LKIIVLLLLFCHASLANSLRWAADTSSGVPYVYSDPTKPENLIGFEYDIIQSIGKRLGKKLEFTNNAWDGLILGLKGNNYDLAINGIEITDDRKKEVAFSDPYYITYEQLTVRKDNNTITSLKDCYGKKVGTLKSAFSEEILTKEKEIQVVTYEEEVAAYSDLENGRIEAVLLDAPIAQYYAAPNPRLKNVGDPIGQMTYGIAIRLEDRDLLAAINKAISEMFASGEMRQILDDWNLWNPLMAVHFNDQSNSRYPPGKYLEYTQATNGLHQQSFLSRLNRYKTYLPLFWEGTIVTLQISILSMVLAVVLGMILAVFRLYFSWPISFLTGFFIECIRGTPLLIQLLFIFYGLPSIGIQLNPMTAAVLGLGINYAAYEAENYRAGILSVPKSINESAFALGMSKWQVLRLVTLPNALRLVIPPVTNDFISLLKDSSLVSVITMMELTKVYSKISTTYFDYLGTGIIVALIYLLIGLPFVKLAKFWEKKLAKEHLRLKPNLD
jgi:polar amino acid transport system substrate-binding protein